MAFTNEAEAAPGTRDQELAEYKERMGLPRWDGLVKELEELAERHDVTWANELQAKIDLHRRYLEYQTLLVINYKSLGLQHVNAMHNLIDLQTKLFELEEKLKGEGLNPLESPEWVRAREMLAKEMQFIHRHKLDVAQFQANVGVRKQRHGDDAMFEVEVDADAKG